MSVFITISAVQMTERTRPQSKLNTYLKLLIKDTVQEEQESRGNYWGSQMLASTALLKSFSLESRPLLQRTNGGYFKTVTFSFH